MRHMRYVGKDFPQLVGKTAIIEPWTKDGWIQAQFDDATLSIEAPDGDVYCPAYGWHGFPESDFEEVT